MPDFACIYTVNLWLMYIYLVQEGSHLSRTILLGSGINNFRNVIFRVPTQIAFFKLPVFSLSDRKFSLCQFTGFMTITYAKLTWQTYPAKNKNWKFLQQLSKYPLPLESAKLQLQQTKFPVFSLTGNFFWPFSLLTLIVIPFRQELFNTDTKSKGIN